MTLSIKGRMLVAASVILAAFLGTTGVVLERSYVASAEEGFRERLRIHLTTLIASADINDEGNALQLVYALPEARFFTPGSGLYAKILNNDGQVLWSSPSLTGVTLPIHAGLSRGESLYEKLIASDGTPVMSFSLGVTWGGEVASPKDAYTFVVAESQDRYQQQLSAFLHSLWGWLAGVAIVLLVMLAVILRWALAPLFRVAEDLGEIKAGRNLELKGEYPRELRGLTDNLNSLIRTNREHEARYRSSLGDLAHSLKTPLAVLRGAVDTHNQPIDSMQAAVGEQVARMDQIVQYQLLRAATSGRTALVAPVDVKVVANKIINAMHKVYADKEVISQVHVSLEEPFHCQEGDLMELLGNVIDNAFKWCERRVEVDVRQEVSGDGLKSLAIKVMDDGRGIEDADIATVLSRGGRLDEQASGHGLGLAMVSDVVNLYGGRLGIGRADLGGAQVEVCLPWR